MTRPVLMLTSVKIPERNLFDIANLFTCSQVDEHCCFYKWMLISLPSLYILSPSPQSHLVPWLYRNTYILWFLYPYIPFCSLSKTPNRNFSPHSWPSHVNLITICYRYNVCSFPTPKFINWIFKPQCGGIQRWGLWEALKFKWGHKGGAP